MFSIIIPLYNKAPYIAKAIQSVAAQTFQKFELIIIDDGSTDDSLEKLRVTSYELGISFEFRVLSSDDNNSTKTKKVRVFQQENQGVSTTRNNGVKLAKFPYICFLDADDWWEPTFLEEMKALVKEFPDAGIYGSGYYKVKNKKLIQANIGIEKGFERGLINYFKVYAKTMYMPLWTGATILKKDIFESENGFRKTLKGGEDFDLWVRIASKFNVAFLNKPLAYYNQDVDLNNRAVGARFLKPEEHMIFTDYGELNENQDFKYLFEILAVYTLLPYYLANKNINQVNAILKDIHWEAHSFKTRLYYLIVPKFIVQIWFRTIKAAVNIKQNILR